MSTSIVRGGYVICEAGVDAGSSRVISDGAVFQRDGVIEAVGGYDEIKAAHQADQELGGPGYLVMPGLVNAHHHGRGVSTFQMGCIDDCLETWILSGWGRRPYDHYLMTLYTAIQMIESGTTTTMYNHAQTPASGLADDVAEVLRGFADAGMRTAFSVYFRERNRVVYQDDEQFISSLPGDLAESLRRFLSAVDLSEEEYFSVFRSLHQDYAGRPDSRVTVLLSPSNVQWVSDDFLLRTKEEAARSNAAVHIHLVESLYQKEYGLRTWGHTPVEHLNTLGFLGPEVSCAHSVWLTDQDIDIMAQTGATACHNPSSNLRLKNGIAPVNAMLERGVNVALGTDSTAINDDDDMVQEMRLAAKLHRQPGLANPALSSHQALRLATANAARPTGLQGKIGTLEPGRFADLVVLDLDAMTEPYMDSGIDVVDTLLYRGKASHIDTVMIQGEVVVRNGTFIKMDKAEVMREIKEQFARPVEGRALDARKLVQGLTPFVQEFYKDWGKSEIAPHYGYSSRV
ncbi:MAG: amidohydrolase family protein [Chloroflexi bacterium]|nr:amidohydrolase family protein [Chloroflexota bacterium]